MTKTLIRIGGAFNILFSLLHLMMSWSIPQYAGVDTAILALMQMLNVGVLLTVAFAAYASFFCTAELAATRLGKSLLVLVAFFYLVRAVEEALLSPAFSVVIFAVCLLVAGLYAAAAFLRLKQAVAA